MKTIEIDGSFGEGGGQILRTALSLSCITGRRLRLFNIRKGRKNPGLMPQHLTSVLAASLISGANMSGAEKGSTELTFSPGRTTAGNYFFDIKTAGACSLVFQTLLPPLVLADGMSTVTIRGGTHVPFSPSYHYLSEVFMPMVHQIGIRVESEIRRYGFYPHGGGEVSFIIYPVQRIRGLSALSRGGLLSVTGYSGVANLPVHIAERQKKSVETGISPFSADITIMDVPSAGRGTFVFLNAQYDHTAAGFTSLGKRGRPAEDVGGEAAQEYLEFHESAACLDEHLPDQIVIYLGLSQEESSFTTSRISQHLITNLWAMKKFLNIRYTLEGKTGSAGRVRIIPG